jgi:hypothetical protein
MCWRKDIRVTAGGDGATLMSMMAAILGYPSCDAK